MNNVVVNGSRFAYIKIAANDDGNGVFGFDVVSDQFDRTLPVLISWQNAS